MSIYKSSNSSIYIFILYQSKSRGNIHLHLKQRKFLYMTLHLFLIVCREFNIQGVFMAYISTPRVSHKIFGSLKLESTYCAKGRKDVRSLVTSLGTPTHICNQLGTWHVDLVKMMSKGQTEHQNWEERRCVECWMYSISNRERGQKGQNASLMEVTGEWPRWVKLSKWLQMAHRRQHQVLLRSG